MFTQIDSSVKIYVRCDVATKLSADNSLQNYKKDLI